MNISFIKNNRFQLVGMAARTGLAVSDAKREAIISAVRSGKNPREAAKEVGIDNTTAYKIVHKAGLSNVKRLTSYEKHLAKRDQKTKCVEYSGKEQRLRDLRKISLGIEKVPKNFLVSVNCGNNKCFAPEHCVLKPLLKIVHKQVLRDTKWKMLMRQIELLPMHGELCIIGERKAKLVRTNLSGINSSALFSLKTEVDGILTVMRVGTKGINFVPRPKLVVAHKVYKRKISNDAKAPGGFFLGFMRNWFVLPEQRAPKCLEKSCFYPALYSGLCRDHLRSYKLKDSPCRGEVEIQDDKDQLLEVQFASKEHKSFLSCFIEGQARRSQSERINDTWWKENIIDKGIIVSNVITDKLQRSRCLH